MFINLHDFSKTYIGQSKNLFNRFEQYLNNSYLRGKKNKQVFPRALLKHGQVSFALIVIEYLPISLLNERESYWISLLTPYYNMSSGGSNGGSFNHSKDTKDQLSKLALGRKHSDLTKSLISKANSGITNPFYGKAHDLETIKRISNSKSAGSILIYNSYKVLLFLIESVLALAKAIKANCSTIDNAIKNKSLFRGNWYFTRAPFSPLDNPRYTHSFSMKKELIKIKQSAHLRKPVYVYRVLGESANIDQSFVQKYDGVLNCAKSLKISHTTIKKYLDKNIAHRGYIFSSHRNF